MKEGKIMKNFKIMTSIFMLAVSFASISAAKKSVVRKASGKKTAVKKVRRKVTSNWNAKSGINLLCGARWRVNPCKK